MVISGLLKSCTYKFQVLYVQFLGFCTYKNEYLYAGAVRRACTYKFHISIARSFFELERERERERGKICTYSPGVQKTRFVRTKHRFCTYKP